MTTPDTADLLREARDILKLCVRRLPISEARKEAAILHDKIVASLARLPGAGPTTIPKKIYTVEELEELLNGPPGYIHILPDGSIETRDTPQTEKPVVPMQSLDVLAAPPAPDGERERFEAGKHRSKFWEAMRGRSYTNHETNIAKEFFDLGGVAATRPPAAAQGKDSPPPDSA